MDGERVWLTRAKYEENSGALSSVYHVTVEETMFTTRKVTKTSGCSDDDGDDAGKCRREEVMYRRYCREALDDLKFKVQQGEPGYE